MLSTIPSLPYICSTQSLLLLFMVQEQNYMYYTLIVMLSHSYMYMYNVSTCTVKYRQSAPTRVTTPPPRSFTSGPAYCQHVLQGALPFATTMSAPLVYFITLVLGRRGALTVLYGTCIVNESSLSESHLVNGCTVIIHVQCIHVCSYIMYMYVRVARTITCIMTHCNVIIQLE